MSVAAWVLSVIYVLNGRAVTEDLMVYTEQKDCTDWTSLLMKWEAHPGLLDGELIAGRMTKQEHDAFTVLINSHGVFSCRGVTSK